MNVRGDVLRQGLSRGWTEFRLSLRSPQDQGFYIFMGVVTLGYLWLNRDDEVGDTGLLYPTVALPGILGALVAFGVIIGPAFSLAMEREDGTLLRLKAVPGGIPAYVIGQLVYHSASLLPLLLIVLLPGAILFDGLMQGGPGGWFTFAWVLVLGLLATLPLGIILGSVVPNAQKVGTWGMLPVFAVTAISGIFFPIQALWTWLQVVAQVFPIYWIGLGMRSAFLPDAAQAAELTGSWRTGWTVVVLAAWAIAGALTAPRVLRRAARRQSGSQVAAARDAALQTVR